MAFSKQPVNSTYTTKTVSFARELAGRGPTRAKDAYLQNCYIEMQKNKEIKDNELVIVKRAGAIEQIPAAGSNGIRGVYLWKDQSKLFVATDDDIYVYNSTTLAAITTLTAVFGSIGGPVGFNEFLYEDTTVKLIATDGATLVTIDTSNTVVAATSPPAHLPIPVFLNGTLYIVGTDSSTIYGSASNDPLDWSDSGNAIDAEMQADKILYISLLNNYIVAFGSRTIEYFYDAANADGSPLSRNDSPIKSVGYLGGFAKHGNKIYFIGETSESVADVYLLEDFKISSLGNEAVRRNFAHGDDGPVAGITGFNGHDFYVVSSSDTTFVLEIETKLWSTWVTAGGSYFPMTNSVPQSTASLPYLNFFTLVGSQAIFGFSTDVHTDDGDDFTVVMVSDNEFFDSYNQKVCNRLSIYADKPTESLEVLMQTSDNDYQTWSTGQSIDLFQELPAKYRWGQFRRRAHKLTYTGDQPLRVYQIELDLNMGTS
jgi:hypothetical protein